ncbi:MAG: hypothetical protein MMC33_000515 [Icmadophila ericetorum]|nr:hypothetical protein [Icmadophila ericetorum]
MAESRNLASVTVQESKVKPHIVLDVQSAQRKPSPLHLIQTSTPTTERFLHSSPVTYGSPGTPKSGSSNSYSPRSPRYSPGINGEQNASNQERLQEVLATEQLAKDEELAARNGPLTGTNSSVTTPRQDTSRQIRKASEPILSSQSAGNSYAQQRSETTPKAGMGHLTPRQVPRNSSIDSTISTMSTTTSQSQQSSQDIIAVSPTEIRTMIASAGSPELAIQQLLREKKNSAAQNAQLWKLVNKQRSLVLGLNKDLERAVQDKERYRKKLKEHLAHVPPLPSPAPQATPKDLRRASVSPDSSDSPDDLPIQRHSVRDPNASVMKAENAVVEASSANVPTSDPEPTSPTQDEPAPLQPLKVRTMPEIPRISTTEVTNTSKTSPKRSDSDRNMPTLAINTSFSKNSSPITPQDMESLSSRSSFTARRSLTTPRTGKGNPVLDVTPPTAIEPNNDTIPTPIRKPPPAPLNLHPVNQISKTLEPHSQDDQSESDYDEILEVDEIPSFERGRRKTREEDDRQREILAMKELESRSLSKKTKPTKSMTLPVEKSPPMASPGLPESLKIRAFSPTFPANSTSRESHLSQPTSLAGMLSGPTSAKSESISERSVISPFPMSPGLPLSPRPNAAHMMLQPRPPRDGTGSLLASPPVSPRGPFPGLPLSPRAPRHPILLPPHTPVSMVSPLPRTEDQSKSVALSSEPPGESEGLLKIETTSTEGSDSAPLAEGLESLQYGNVYRGLVSEAYPDLLLPPNALPSILVKVTSSRLKPSRHSTLSFKGPEEEPVFTLGISSRSHQQQLWQLEKPVVSLPPLEQQLKQLSSFNVKLPDRSLFTGHSPAKIDARRAALEKYFEAILDTPMDEKAALVVCRYLSTQVIQSSGSEPTTADGKSEHSPHVSLGPGGRKIKEGYLTKRGKNFGGWKARFFVLDEPTLRYYESPGGPLLGTIKLQNAQIGRQTAPHSGLSPAQGPEESDNHFRHAFLILEPKRKDSNNHLRHVLCAENDQERDGWVSALMEYVDTQAVGEEKPRPGLPRNDSSGSKVPLMSKKKGTKDGDIPEHEVVDRLQSVSYENTAPGQPPVRVAPTPREAETPSPVNDSQAAQPSKTISGPTNGTVIQDVGAWGNRAVDSPRSKEKEKKRSIWGFRDKLIGDSGTPSLTDQFHSSIRPNSDQRNDVFGMVLAAAVENCGPKGVNVCLPAVVYRCLEYLQAKDAASEEGIFRLSGSNLVIKALRERFNNEGDIDLCTDGQYYDVHAVASLLKQYLRELPTMILTRELHLDFLQALELDERTKKITAWKGLVARLPLPNWTLIRALSAFLIGIVNNSEVNRMNVRNVGIVFSPTLNIPAPVISAFLIDFDDIFALEHASSEPIQTVTVSAPEPLTPEDIRSPRHQLFSDIPTPSFDQNTFANFANRPKFGGDIFQNFSFQKETGTGFIPLKPSYETNIVRPPNQNQARSPPSFERTDTPENNRTDTPPIAEYGAFPRTPNSGLLGFSRDEKSKRRESSMLNLNGNYGQSYGQRKLSLPLLRNSTVIFHESAKDAFE